MMGRADGEDTGWCKRIDSRLPFVIHWICRYDLEVGVYVVLVLREPVKQMVFFYEVYENV